MLWTDAEVLVDDAGAVPRVAGRCRPRRLARRRQLARVPLARRRDRRGHRDRRAQGDDDRGLHRRRGARRRGSADGQAAGRRIDGPRGVRAVGRVRACSGTYTARGSCCWSARATTAGTRCTPAPTSPGAERTSPPCSRAGQGARAVSALRDAGGRGRRTGERRCDLVVDGIVGIGGHGGLRDAAIAWLRRRGTRARSPSTCRPGWTPTPAPAGEHSVHADITVTFGALKAGLLVGAARSTPARCGWSTSASASARAAHARAGGRRRARLLPSPDAASGQVHPRRRRHRRRFGRLPGRRRADAPARRSTAGPAWCVTRGGRRRGPRALPGGRRARDGRPHEAARAGLGDRPGIGTDAAARDLLADVLATDVPVIVDADG